MMAKICAVYSKYPLVAILILNIETTESAPTFLYTYLFWDNGDNGFIAILRTYYYLYKNRNLGNF